MLQRLRHGYEGVRGRGTGSHDEQTAVLELLLATMYADGTLALAEGDEIAAFGREHGWDTAEFSFEQAYGQAVARVREARDTVGGLDVLLADADLRIADPALRGEVAAACRTVAAADDTVETDEESWLALVAQTFDA